MIATEARLEQAATSMAARSNHLVDPAAQSRALEAAERRGLILSGEQRAAFDHVARGERLRVVIGYAGTGKSAMLGVAKEAWEASGYRVRGAALSGIAAENLEGGSAIPSRTLASLEYAWGKGNDLLGARDVLVIDEAGMIGTRQMERVVSAAKDAGAKIVMVGDPQQLQAIEAGAAFRAIHERHGGVEITEIRRQREDWQRDATRHLATGRTGEALEAYHDHGAVHVANTREAARGDLIERWDCDRRTHPDDSRIILTHTNDEVRVLNEAAREKMRRAGELGGDVAVQTERGERQFASGDRIMFLRNERGLAVKNGTLGEIELVNAKRMTVGIGDGRRVAFDLKDYAHIDHGYAATVHKAQGMTVDRTHVLATPGMDSHGAYVALSRHRDGVDLHYSKDDFADPDRLALTLSRERAKDMASDYREADATQAFAERRGITFRQRVAELVRKVPEKVRGIFDGFRPKQNGLEILPEQKAAGTPESRAVERYARSVQDIARMREQGLPVLPHQSEALDRAAQALDALRPEAARDLAAAFTRRPDLAAKASAGRSQDAIRAMNHEAAVRLDPVLRAERFVGDWKQLEAHRTQLREQGDEAGARKLAAQMRGMAKGLERDPELEAELRGQLKELGVQQRSERSLRQDLADTLGKERTRPFDIGL